jgi:hypothetical protein
VSFGLLGLLGCACRDVEEINADVIVVVELLMKDMAYRSLLKVSSNIPSDPSVPMLEAQIPKEGEFWLIWKSFKALLEARLKIRAGFDEENKGYSQPCSSGEVCHHLRPVVEGNIYND